VINDIFLYNERMELREYLFRHRIKGVDFAKKVGYNHLYLYKIMAYKCPIGKKLAMLLMIATNGEIKQEDIDAHNKRVKNENIKLQENG